MALRLGIDVGGTFTDVVAIDASRTIVARVKVPTTHDHPDGVAAGIVDGIQRVLQAPGVSAAAVAFVAHSTTQATNALLEGDVAKVGIIGLLDRFDGPLVRAHVGLRPMTLAPGAVFAPSYAFAPAHDAAAIATAVDGLVASGCTALAASAAFGVDRTQVEDRVVELARERGVAATSGHDVASTYGLRARTRTAALNAAILPTMVRTARMTAGAARQAGIPAPLMIMRSDGGVMDVREVERRPILTMLSGPAAGIAGALLYENVSDGIFIEVGGTSSDLSVIRRGRPQMRPARVGGHRTLLRTLDVRTLAIAGGSLLRVDVHKRGIEAVHDVGPRSAHIAGMKYACFVDREAIGSARFELTRPREADPADCATLVTADGTRIGLTPTCAANLLGLVDAAAFAHGDAEAARLAFARVGDELGCSGEALARALLERACSKVRDAVETLIREYELDARGLELVGGGGGAAALLPFLAQTMSLPFRIARDAEMISPVGVALALVRDSVERTIANPTPDDIVRVRREAFERVVAAGAAPTLVEVTVELDPRRNLVRATASGATEAASVDSPPSAELAGDLPAVAARAAHVERPAVTVAAEIERFVAFAIRREQRGPAWLPFAWTRTTFDACIVERSGIARLIVPRAQIVPCTRGSLQRSLSALLEEHTAFGDVGRALPDCSLVYGSRIVDLSGLADPAAILALAEEELRGLDDATALIVVLGTRSA